MTELHYDAGTSIHNGMGGEITQFNCGCGLSFAEQSELDAHSAAARIKAAFKVVHNRLAEAGLRTSRGELQAQQDATEVLQPEAIGDLNAKLGQTIDQLNAHLVKATCDESYIDGRSDTWREE